MELHELHPEDPAQWASLHFAQAELGDARRVKRATRMATALLRSPGESLPRLFAQGREVKAAYRFLGNPHVDPMGLQAGHHARVRAALQLPGTYLLIEDSSEFSYSGRQPIAGLGFIGNARAGLRGFILHSTLAVRWLGGDEARRRPPVEVLGVVDQHYRVRREKLDRGKETSTQRKHRPRESEVWLQSGAGLGSAPGDPQVRWVRVADRGADIYELLAQCQQLGQGFVIRAAQDRGLVEGGEGIGRLFPTLRAEAAWGGFELELRRRGNQAARVAGLQVSALAVQLVAPQRPGSARGGLPPIACTAVRVWEQSPPEGVEPLEWLLLTDRRVDTLAQAREVVQQYATRWLIEEFHKALKTGLGAERLQLERAERIFAAVALMSVVATRLLALREWVRLIPEAPAERCGLETLELEVLRTYTHQPLHTVGEVALALGRLGGHQGRKGDGMPGWLTLWRGMTKLQVLAEGVRLAHKIKTYG